MSPAEKIAVVTGLTQTVVDLALAGVRQGGAQRRGLPASNAVVFHRSITAWGTAVAIMHGTWAMALTSSAW